MSNAMIRPGRPVTNMQLTGVTAYAVDLAVMLAKLLVAHGHIDEEPADLEGLLAAGDAAIAAVSKCPQCDGPADRGVDKCIPPSAYMCSRCSETEETQRRDCAS